MARVATAAETDGPRVADDPTSPVAMCEVHGAPLLDPRLVDAWVILLGWDDAFVGHACELELEVHRAL